MCAVQAGFLGKRTLVLEKNDQARRQNTYQRRRPLQLYQSVFFATAIYFAKRAFLQISLCAVDGGRYHQFF